MTAITKRVDRGTWLGSIIRTARKAGRCDYYLGVARGGRCANIIAVGSQYFEGELSDSKAGGFGRDRYCMEHIDGI